MFTLQLSRQQHRHHWLGSIFYLPLPFPSLTVPTSPVSPSLTNLLRILALCLSLPGLWVFFQAPKSLLPSELSNRVKVDSPATAPFSGRNVEGGFLIKSLSLPLLLFHLLFFFFQRPFFFYIPLNFLFDPSLYIIRPLNSMRVGLRWFVRYRLRLHA